MLELDDNFKAPLPIKKRLREDEIKTIINWIQNNRNFLAASFEGKLDNWVKRKLKRNTENRKIIDNFTVDFNEKLELSIDVRKSDPDQFPCPIACFIDAITGIWPVEERNQRLQLFLEKNIELARFLLSNLNKLNPIVKIWQAEQTELAAQSLQALFSQADVLNKPLPIPRLITVQENKDNSKYRKLNLIDLKL